MTPRAHSDPPATCTRNRDERRAQEARVYASVTPETRPGACLRLPPTGRHPAGTRPRQGCACVAVVTSDVIARSAGLGVRNRRRPHSIQARGHHRQPVEPPRSVTAGVDSVSRLRTTGATRLAIQAGSVIQVGASRTETWARAWVGRLTAQGYGRLGSRCPSQHRFYWGHSKARAFCAEMLKGE